MSAGVETLSLNGETKATELVDASTQLDTAEEKAAEQVRFILHFLFFYFETNCQKLKNKIKIANISGWHF